jgi:hypothetical protein
MNDKEVTGIAEKPRNRNWGRGRDLKEREWGFYGNGIDDNDGLIIEG